MYWHDAEPKIVTFFSWRKTTMDKADQLRCFSLRTQQNFYRSADVMFNATGAKHHTVLPQVNTSPLLIIIIVQFGFIITQYIFALSFNLYGPYQLYDNWVLIFTPFSWSICLALLCPCNEFFYTKDFLQIFFFKLLLLPLYLQYCWMCHIQALPHPLLN